MQLFKWCNSNSQSSKWLLSRLFSNKLNNEALPTRNNNNNLRCSSNSRCQLDNHKLLFGNNNNKLFPNNSKPLFSSNKFLFNNSKSLFYNSKLLFSSNRPLSNSINKLPYNNDNLFHNTSNNSLFSNNNIRPNSSNSSGHMFSSLSNNKQCLDNNNNHKHILVKDRFFINRRKRWLRFCKSKVGMANSSSKKVLKSPHYKSQNLREEQVEET